MRAERTRLAAFTAAAALLLPWHAWAQGAAGGDSGESGDYAVSYGPKRIIRDIKDYATAPLRWDGTDWMYFGGTLVAVEAARQFDVRVRRQFTAGSPAALNGKDTHSLQDALPAAAAVLATGLYATLIDDAAGRAETWSMLEAGALASTTGLMLKIAAGRQRPDQTVDPNRWRANGGSFPSLHVTAAFAIGTVLAESGNDRYRWIRRFLGYGIAAATGYERLKHNAHWLSDTVAGAALGMASAHFVLHREYRREPAAAWTLLPIDRGVMLAYSVPLH
ncbi:MAG TPA: phosphatase PAP2 family protein [Steroidobacteraceae bacterium]|nr:phosphatase PAP2 family protein [Steroidobacteraceae bacterium]